MIFHAGALGDFVLTWPLLRALRATGPAPIVVAADGHAVLARRCLGIRAISAERREVTALWREHTDAAELAGAWDRVLLVQPPAGSITTRSVALVVTFTADDRTAAGRCWLAATRHAFPNAEVLALGPPGTPARAGAWSRFDAARAGAAVARVNAGGPVVLHVGAGSEEKRWPLERWVAVAHALRDDGRAVTLLAGEVERERMSAGERASFEQTGGRTLDNLDELADVLEPCGAFIGADTGPTHLAAQLGLPTLALFGPTDPRLWAPIGPRVRVLAPASACPMTWINPEMVRLSLNNLLTPPDGAQEHK